MTHNAALDHIRALHEKWKPGTCKRVAVAILSAMLKGATWPDEIDLSWVPPEDVNVIGTTWRKLAQAKLIEHTRAYRPSKSPQSNGRVVFQSILVNRAAAEAFIALPDQYQFDLTNAE